MSKKTGIDLLRDQAIAQVNEEIELVDEWALGDSPIETLFLAALTLHFRLTRTEFAADVVVIDDENRSRVLETEHYHRHVVIEKQVKIERLKNWRVDFVAYAWTYGTTWTVGVGRQDGKPRWRRLIIECDGHEYHERTKEQAARDRKRDREAASWGYDIQRFTGSEIWGDPWACAKEVYDWAVRSIY